ncbi:MAG TPA: hypothetical protein VIQ04_07770 [Nitrososphaeraceae archaeon]
MNILEVEFPLKIEAKTTRYNDKTNVIYSIAELQHNFCIDKKEIIIEQIKACENLSRYNINKSDSLALEREIYELKIALNILH